MSKGENSLISNSLINDSSDDGITCEWADIDDHQLNWFTILAIFALVSFQLLLVVTVGAIVVSHSWISHFVLHTGSGLTVYIISIVLWFIIQCFHLEFRKHWPYNCVLFLLWSLSYAFAIGFSCSFSNGRGNTVLAAVIWMSIVTVSLTLYSVWAMIKKLDFSLSGPCIFFILLLICIYIPIQVFHPFAKLSTAIYGFVAAVLFCFHIVVAGNRIIKELSQSRDDSASGAIFAATAFFYWHFLLNIKPSRRDIGV